MLASERSHGAPLDQIRTADEAARYLDGLIDRERVPDSARGRIRGRLGLGPIRALLEAVGDPQGRLSIVHVAGSKGKGSLCLSAEPVLGALGERVGVFTSPHLERWTERFRVDGEEVAGDRLAAAVEQLRPHVDRLATQSQNPTDSPSFFDATTAVALLLFAEAGVDRVLLEVGLGGRLDSTNAVEPRVTCVTQIELEHTQVLGDTLAKVAAEKAGILKPGVCCVMGRLVPEADAVVRARAREVGAPLLAEGEHFEIAAEPEPGSHGRATRLHYREAGGFGTELVLPVAGGHLAHNAGLALACVRALAEHSDEDVDRAARSSLSGLRLPGRVELASRHPLVVVDSAHTECSARALADALGELAVERAELVVSVSQGKAVTSILAALLPRAARVTLTCADSDRSLRPEQLASRVSELAPGLEQAIVPDPRRAVREACARAGSEGAVVIAGSVYLAGIAREVLREATPPEEPR